MSGRAGRPWVVGAALISLGALLTAAERSAAERPESAGRRTHCPSGTYLDEAHAARVIGLLARSERGRQLRQQAARVHTICFGPAHRSALVGRGEALILDAVGGDVANAARLGHLLSHATALAALPDLDSSTASCDAAVELAGLAEKQAYAIERELRRELGDRDALFDLEGSDPWLALEPAYRTRCEAALGSGPARRRASAVSGSASRAPHGVGERATVP